MKQCAGNKLVIK